ncbi:GDCCVxC domain-containing (seleno)protein [Christiangramia echinicola]|uniref:GDCCVxC domain-containing (seleno)protein n=1 Tax=Christiangramia echinicola TaxID=279359 RepID=UPI000A009E14|nr:GDCCVxC domain-containing (seleno)protein [Christiangramia echinicola]
METILKSILTCPRCKDAREEIMPTDACQFFHECSSCGTIIKPLEGDCCVFCSYGSVLCPPIQEARSCCNSNGG